MMDADYDYYLISSRGEVGLASLNGQPLLLAEGLHVKNDRLFQFHEFQSINQPHIHHGSVHVIRVPKGYYGLVTENSIPKFLQEGNYPSS